MLQIRNWDQIEKLKGNSEIEIDELCIGARMNKV
jgi:hypothetical protein